MRSTRSFVDAPLHPGESITLPEPASAHLLRVLRLRPGDRCRLFNGDGLDYPAELIGNAGKRAELRVLAAEPVDRESPLRLELAQGIARGEKMDLILQKATELGVAAIHPLYTERTEVRLDAARAEKRLQHWQAVVTAACEQSGRAIVPRVAEPRPLQTFLDTDRDSRGLRLLLDPAGSERLAALASAAGERIMLLVGPEGGLGERDRGPALAAGYRGLRLGPRILRTETAGLAAIAALQAQLGDFG